ncbi:hypothetical protein [Tolypothrix sp. PCC 7712]|nr:hypothetical protein [Tolypothrix sp. PCC 7712]
MANYVGVVLQKLHNLRAMTTHAPFAYALFICDVITDVLVRP